MMAPSALGGAPAKRPIYLSCKAVVWKRTAFGADCNPRVTADGVGAALRIPWNRSETFSLPSSRAETVASVHKKQDSWSSSHAPFFTCGAFRTPSWRAYNGRCMQYDRFLCARDVPNGDQPWAVMSAPLFTAAIV
jgi:hypothetical protein